MDGNLVLLLSRHPTHPSAPGRRLLGDWLRKTSVSENHFRRTRCRQPLILTRILDRRHLRPLTYPQMAVPTEQIHLVAGLGVRREAGMPRDPYSRIHQLPQPE